MRINAMLWMIGDYAQLGAAYFCLGCDLGRILSGICCGARSRLDGVRVSRNSKGTFV